MSRSRIVSRRLRQVLPSVDNPRVVNPADPNAVGGVMVNASAVDPTVTQIGFEIADITFRYDNGLPRIDAVDVRAAGKFVYVDPAVGNDNLSKAIAGVAATPWKSTYKLYSGLSAGDGAYIASGTYTASGSGDYGDTFHSLGKQAMTWICDDNVVLKNTGRSNPLLFISSALPNGAVSKFKKLIADGEGLTQTLLGNIDMVDSAWNILFEECQFLSPLNYAVLLSPVKIGTFTFDGCIFTGGPTGAGFTLSTSGLAASGNVVINVLDAEFNYSRAGTVYCINQDVPSTALTNFALIITGGTYLVTHKGASGFPCGIYVATPATPISKVKMTVNADEINTNSALGILHKSSNANNVVTDAHIFDNTITFNAPGGYAIALGGAAVATSGVIEGNTIIGKYYAAKTPHGIAINDLAIATCRYNKISDSYACLLASKCGATSITDNVVFNGYGADFYAKGVQTATVFNKNVSITTGKYVRKNLGNLSVDSQGGVLSNAVTMSNNVVLIANDDVSKIGALVNVTINNTCTFTNNVYLVPDSIPDSTVLFYVGGSEGGRAGATGYTIDQWRAATSITNGSGTITVTNDRILKLPLTDIKALARNLGVSIQ